MPKELHLVAKIRRVGNSLAVLIPAAEARAAELEEGQAVELTIQPQPVEVFGLLKDVPYRPFSRRGLWRDRI